MKCKNQLLLLVILAIIGSDQAAFGQRDAGAKARGEFGTGFWSSRYSSRRLGHAREYSQGLHRYAGRAQSVSPNFSRIQAEELGVAITDVQQQVGEVAKEAGEKDDKDTVASADAILKQLAVAAEQHAKCMETCKKESVDREMVMACCKAITDALSAAQTEHDKMMKRLYPDQRED